MYCKIAISFLAGSVYAKPFHRQLTSFRFDSGVADRAGFLSIYVTDAPTRL